MSKKEQKLNSFCSQCEASCNVISSIQGVGGEVTRPSLLLHSCCGPCSSSVIERLAPDYNITVYFYNPCITDSEEYEKRKATQLKFINGYNSKFQGSSSISFLEGDYEPLEYIEKVKGHENDPEGGERCTLCFKMRLEKTGAVAKQKGYQVFGTTLTVSPHKNYPLISDIGNEIAMKLGIEFLDMDFKKKAGFQRSIQLSKEYDLYRQNYCGCMYSIRDNID